MSFTFSRPISFYETDAMGIMHHAAYLHLLEDARVAWIGRVPGFEGDFLENINFPLLRVEVDYKKPLKFNDRPEVFLTPKLMGPRLEFTYEVKLGELVISRGITLHAVMDMQTGRIIKPPKNLQDFISDIGESPISPN